MTPTEFGKIIARLKEQLTDLDEAILLLSRVLEDGKMADFLIGFRARRETIRESAWMNHLDNEEKRRQESILRDQLLEFINRIRMEDLKEHIEIKILVICPDKTAQADMRAYFAKLPLHADTAVSSDQPSTADYHLLVLDNRALPAIPKKEDEANAMAGDDKVLLRSHFQWIKDTLSETSKYAVHLGEQNFLVNKYREKVHAANSKFALYARIHEVLDYMRATQASILKPD